MSQYYIDAFFSVFSGIKQEEKVIENPVKMQLEMLIEPIMGYLQPIMWLFTVPVLKIALQTGVALAAIFLLIQIIRWSVQGSTRNPFANGQLISECLLGVKDFPKTTTKHLTNFYARTKVGD